MTRLVRKWRELLARLSFRIEVSAMTAAWPDRLLDWLAGRFGEDRALRFALRVVKATNPEEYRRLQVERPDLFD